MNYRHVFHAGNFADVVKHTILTRILAYLMRKDAPFRVIDTHAGVGLYDLKGAAAEKTGEWADGIGRLIDRDLSEPARTLLAPYLAAIRAQNPGGDLRFYPGSPLITRHMLRQQDRLMALELH
ncbi:MAG: 23S rRNA (adenine(2030)-N(6))-methyltransferase RlmJ, partial [Proteobacteria bacterium]